MIYVETVKDAAADSTPESKTWQVGTLTYTTTGLIVLFCWLLWGDFAWSMKERTVGPVLGVLFHEFHASDLVTGLFFTTLPAGIGMILSPIVSFRSDRHRGRWGRRIPFLLIPTPFVVLGMLGLAYSPMLGARVHGMLGPTAPSSETIVILSFGIFWALFDIATVVTQTVYNALINDVVPQEVMGRFYGLFRAVTLIAGALFNYSIFGKADTEYIWIFLGMGTLYGVGFVLMCRNVREGDYPPVPPMDKGRDIHGFLHAAKTYFQECFSLPYYRWYFAFNAISAIITSPINLFTLYFSKSPGINMTTDALGKYITLMMLISLCLSYPLGALADRIHPIRASMAALVLYALGTMWGGLFARDQSTFIIAFLMNGVLSGIYFTTSSSLGQRLLPRAEFAQFSSAGGIIIALCSMALGPAVGMFLDHVHHAYRYTFLMSCILSLVALVGLIIVYRKFLELGGPDSYKAPEPSAKKSGPQADRRASPSCR
jgi:MFS family permease